MVKEEVYMFIYKLLELLASEADNIFLASAGGK